MLTIRNSQFLLLMVVATALVGCGDAKNTEPDGIDYDVSDSKAMASKTRDSKAGASNAAAVLTVNTIDAQQATYYTVEREYVGVVKAGQLANLGFELAGKVEQLFVDVGDTVSKGQPLIRLDIDLLATEASQLNAQKEEVKAQLNLVAANLKRQRTLKSKGFSAESEIDSLTSQQRVLQANMLRTNAELKANALKQSKSTILAPFDGTIAKRQVSLGDVVNVGSSTFTLLASEDKEAFIGIPASQLEKVTALAAPKIRIGRSDHLVKLLNPGAMVDTRSRSIGLRYLLPSDARVLEGQLAYLLFEERIDEQGYWVPLTALIDGLRGVWNIFIIGEGGLVERRSVEVLFADNQRAFVKGAISDGEAIISSGLHRVVPGQPVQNQAGESQAMNSSQFLPLDSVNREL